MYLGMLEVRVFPLSLFLLPFYNLQTYIFELLLLNMGRKFSSKPKQLVLRCRELKTKGFIQEEAWPQLAPSLSTLKRWLSAEGTTWRKLKPFEIQGAQNPSGLSSAQPEKKPRCAKELPEPKAFPTSDVQETIPDEITADYLEHRILHAKDKDDLAICKMLQEFLVKKEKMAKQLPQALDEKTEEELIEIVRNYIGFD